MKYVQLKWATWSDVCDIVSRKYFKVGVWLHPTDDSIYDREVPTKNLRNFSATYLRIGLLLKDGRLVIENDFIVVIKNKVEIVKEKDFPRRINLKTILERRI